MIRETPEVRSNFPNAHIPDFSQSLTAPFRLETTAQVSPQKDLETKHKKKNEKKNKNVENCEIWENL